jgi:small subunit ribosomal protein S17
MMKTEKRKERIGVVISNKMQKTVVVECESTYVHPFYNKVLREYKRIKAHDAEGKCQVGDQVVIVGTRPLSRDKSHRVVRILGKVRVKMRELPKKAEKEEKASDTGREPAKSSG